jgi:hypothetical protein
MLGTLYKCVHGNLLSDLKCLARQAHVSVDQELEAEIESAQVTLTEAKHAVPMMR